MSPPVALPLDMDGRDPKAEPVTLLSTPYVTLEQVEPRIMRYTRLSVPYPDVQSVTDDFESVIAALAPLQCEDSGLIVDLRAATGRNDEAFERAVAHQRPRVLGRFRAVAVVVSTVVGRLQMARHASEDGVGMQPFTSPSEALQWLKQQLAHP